MILKNEIFANGKFYEYLSYYKPEYGHFPHFDANERSHFNKLEKLFQYDLVMNDER